MWRLGLIAAQVHGGILLSLMNQIYLSCNEGCERLQYHSKGTAQTATTLGARRWTSKPAGENTPAAL